MSPLRVSSTAGSPWNGKDADGLANCAAAISGAVAGGCLGLGAGEGPTENQKEPGTGAAANWNGWAALEGGGEEGPACEPAVTGIGPAAGCT